MEATATVQTAPDFTKLAEQLVELSKFFESIQKSTKVYGDNNEGTKVMKLAEHADVVRSRKEKKLEKIQYQERLKDAKDEFLIGKQIARKEFQINRKVKGNVTFEKIHYMREAFKKSRTHKNLLSAAISAFITGFSLGHKQTQINRYKKQIALLTVKEEYRAAQKKTLELYVQKQKELRDAHKAAMKKPKKDTSERDRQKVLKSIDAKPFDIHEALDLGLIPRYGTKEYKALPQERKDALKIATKKCTNPQNGESKAVTFKDFREMVDRYEEMILVTRSSQRSPSKNVQRTSPQKPKKPRVTPNPDPVKTRPMTR